MSNNRERALTNYCQPEDRTQFDSEDVSRIEKLGELVARAALLMIEGLGMYRDELLKDGADEEGVENMKTARYNVLYGWTAFQTASSKVAWALRFDGDEAYFKGLEAAVREEEPDLNGL